VSKNGHNLGTVVFCENFVAPFELIKLSMSYSEKFIGISARWTQNPSQGNLCAGSSPVPGTPITPEIY
jgi:hypothetical protein